MLSPEDIWRTIPPDEKLSLLAKAQSSGFFSSTVFIAMAFTLAVALQLKWLLFAGVLGAPLVFQITSHKAWRGLKPKVILEYLAARSVARRFAYAAKGVSLNCRLLFRGHVLKIKSKESGDVDELIESVEYGPQESDAWISLFPRMVVVFRESPLGATLVFAAPIDWRIELDARNRDGSDDEYSSQRELIVTVKKAKPPHDVYKITSDYPAPLAVFEKSLMQELKNEAEFRENTRKNLEEWSWATGEADKDALYN